MKQVIVFPRGQLNSKDRERLSKAGLLAVEADDPSKVVTVIPGANKITGDDLLVAALDALAQNTYTKDGYFLGKVRDLARARNPEAAAIVNPPKVAE